MNNKNILTDKLGEIDSRFLDEYHDRRSRRGVRRKNVMKYCSIAASVMLVITISIATMLPMFRNIPTGNPVDTSNGVIDNQDSNKDNADSNKDNPVKDNNKPDYSNYTVIYADEKDYSLDDKVEVEVDIEPLQPGVVRFSGELNEILKSDEAYENTLFAVEMSFNMEFEESAEYKQMLADAQSINDLMWERYNNEFLPHIKTHSHTQGTMDWSCDECIGLHNLHETDESDIDNMYREADNILETDLEEHAEKVKERAEAYISSLGLEFKNVKVIWSDDPEKVDESTSVWEVRFTYLTKEQLTSFEAPEDLGIELSLVPEWIDTEEEVIYRSQDLYPFTLE